MELSNQKKLKNQITKRMENKRKAITEEQRVHKEWYKEAKDKNITIETLPTFINHLVNDYEHDYGTIVHALTCGAIATITAMNRTEQGGITGFQAGCVMWAFIRGWMKEDNKLGMQLLDFDDLLYPQYESKFANTMKKSQAELLMKTAKEKIEEINKEMIVYNKNVEKYKKDIAEYVKKNPDYYENKKHYDPVGLGTLAELNECDRRRKEGFEFAPQMPYNPHPDIVVWRHWLKIANGILPFGFVISD